MIKGHAPANNIDDKRPTLVAVWLLWLLNRIVHQVSLLLLSHPVAEEHVNACRRVSRKRSEAAASSLTLSTCEGVGDVEELEVRLRAKAREVLHHLTAHLQSVWRSAQKTTACLICKPAASSASEWTKTKTKTRTRTRILARTR
jgi:hypothetical protein